LCLTREPATRAISSAINSSKRIPDVALVTIGNPRVIVAYIFPGFGRGGLRSFGVSAEVFSGGSPLGMNTSQIGLACCRIADLEPCCVVIPSTCPFHLHLHLPPPSHSHHLHSTASTTHSASAIDGRRPSRFSPWTTLSPSHIFSEFPSPMWTNRDSV
jgi:hypothetical protein